MVTTDFISIIENSFKINQKQTADLKLITEKYPYFQSARALYLKGLKNQDSFKYNNELKITAAYTTDRTILFNFITSNIFTKTVKENIHGQIIEKIAKISSDEKTPETFQQEIKEELFIGKPLSFTSTETHSFGEWLQLSSKKPIVRTFEEIEEKVSEKESIIDRFIQNNPKIIPVEKGKDIAVSVDKNKQESSLMTETLAKVYLEQNKYENAIQAYKILSLKYPEKSGFFADQIKRVQILQKK